MAIERVWEQRGLLARASGAVTPEEIVGFTRAVSSDPRFDNLRYVLVDLTRALPPESTDIDDVSEAIALRFGASRTNAAIVEAYVVTDPKRLARLQAVTARGMTPFATRIFDTVENARNWIESRLAR